MRIVLIFILLPLFPLMACAWFLAVFILSIGCMVAYALGWKAEAERLDRWMDRITPSS